MSRWKLYIVAALLTCALAVAGFLVGGQSTSAQSKPTSSSQKPEVSTAVKYDLSPPLTEMIAKAGPVKFTNLGEISEGFSTDKPAVNKGYSGDGALQSSLGLGSPLIPSPIITFTGIPNTCNCSPPDPVGDVGPNHYVQMVNLHFQIFNKAGTPLTAVAANNTIWAGFGGPCQTENAGDPIVLHDQLADRWLLTQFTDTGAPFFNCVAVSQTSDPTGAYHRYAFSTPSFPDYPKYGVWPDAYYINTRESGIGVLGNIALERDQMLIGNPAARQVRFTTNETSPLGQGLLPSDLDGAVLPPAGSPNYFVGTQDNDAGAASDAVLLYKFHVDWANTANSTFTGPTIIPAAPFDSIFPCTPGSRDCIPQPGTSAKLDILSYRQRPTFRLAYRNYLSHESLVTSQSVEAQPGVAGMRWYELRSPNTTPVIFQQGTYSPDTTIHRWMGSIAMDGSGNMALGYSVSNGTNVFPGMRYTGRLASDPLGTMPQGEGIFINGTGSQTGSPRWGDYTSMNVDPTDDCTFWYTNEFVPTTSSVGWRAAVGAFKFPGCTAAGGTPTPTVTGTPPTNTPTRTATITSTTTNTPVPSATPCAFTQVMNEGFEAGTLGAFTQTVIITSTTTPVPTPGWASVASNPHSGTRSAFAPDPDRTTDSRLATINNINIPAGVSTATLTFWHRFAFENLFDGGVLEVSTDGGTTWADADANIQQGGYNGTITVFQGCVTAGTPPPWPNGKRVWTSSQTTYGQVRVNLLPYQGTNMKFRFRLGTDCSVSNTGWNVDDVVVSYAGACATVTGTPPTNTPISTATRTVTPGTAVVSPTVCAATPVNLVLDDGTVENSVGWTNSTMNFTAIWFNRASPPAASFPMNLTNMSIKWPNSAALVGKTIALLVYSDADGDGDPSDAVKVAQVNGQTITVANGTTFQDFPINVNIPTPGDVYFGFADTYNSGGVSPRTFPAPLDTTATQGRSWVAAQDGTEDPDFDNLGNNDNLGTIDALSGGALAGNWVIRASGTGGGGCVTGTPVSTSVASTTPMVSPTVCVGSTQLVQDGSFEGGSPSSVWTEKSTNFGTPLCNAACGSGGGTAGPRTGDWWAWFGGTSDEEDGAVSQTVNIPAGGATLSFYLWLGAHSGGGTSDFLRVLVGGTEVFRADDTSTAYDAGYTLVTVPVAATGSVILRFEEHNEAGSGVINFSVDDVSLTAGGNCPTVVATITSVASSTRTATSTAVASATRTATIPVAATSTATTGVVATQTSVPPTSCPLEFSDVPPNSTFYTYIRCLVCRFIISGYNDNTFRPNNNITRGQIAKMVSNSAGINDNPGDQIYEDVNNTNPFYTWINRLTRRGYIGGYPCGTNIYEPCGAENMPYFRPGANATRGQLSKIVATAAQFNEPVSGQFFADVPDDNPFYVWIQRLATRNIMGGYACGSVPSEPCDDQNRPYFRWTNEVTRGQASKIVAGAFFPNCQTPGAADVKSDSPYARNPNGKQSDPLRLTSSQDARNGR